MKHHRGLTVLAFAGVLAAGLSAASARATLIESTLFGATRLVLLYRRTPMAQIVGSDIAHACL